MWSTETLWFEVAVVSIVFALGNILFAHFEERTPRWRPIVKYILTLIIVIMLSVYAGRAVSMGLLAFMLLPLLYIHGYYLPRKKGINGWTGEPKGRYYDFRGWSKKIFEEE